MQFAHTRNDSFLRFSINMNSESRILTLEAVHSFGEVGGILGVFGFDGERDDGFGHEHGSLCMLAYESTK
jgi:hypothetical protein